MNYGSIVYKIDTNGNISEITKNQAYIGYHWNKDTKSWSDDDDEEIPIPCTYLGGHVIIMDDDIAISFEWLRMPNIFIRNGDDWVAKDYLSIIKDMCNNDAYYACYPDVECQFIYNRISHDFEYKHLQVNFDKLASFNVGDILFSVDRDFGEYFNKWDISIPNGNKYCVVIGDFGDNFDTSYLLKYIQKNIEFNVNDSGIMYSYFDHARISKKGPKHYVYKARKKDDNRYCKSKIHKYIKEAIKHFFSGKLYEAKCDIWKINLYIRIYLSMA